MKMPGTPALIAGGVAIAVLALWWFARKGNASAVGNAVGGAAVDLITGTVGGVAHAVAVTANDPSANPLQPFGDWLGGTIYNVTH